MIGKSFVGNGAMGGGGGSGGRILRTAHRPVRTGVGSGGAAAQESFSHSTTNTTANTSSSSSSRHPYNKRSSNTLSLSSSSSGASLHPPFSSRNLLLSASLTSYSSAPYADESDWVYVDANENDSAYGFCDDVVFGTVPSTYEVQNAVSALQQVLDSSPISHMANDRFQCGLSKDEADLVPSPAGSMHGDSSVGSELDWLEPSMHLCGLNLLQTREYNRVYDAFHLLQTDPSIKRMVVSLSSDSAVWKAALNNEVVREIRESFDEAINGGGAVAKSSDENPGGSNAAGDILSWLFVNTKARVVEFIENITKLLNDTFFQPQDKEKTAEGKYPFEEKLKMSFMLSVVVMLVVVLTRARGA